MSNVADYMDDYGIAARSQAVGTIDDSPDDAARSLELEKATGTPASVVHADLPAFEQRHKALLAGGIVGQNPYLQDYINSHPLAGPLSADDYGNLDEASQAAKALKYQMAAQHPLALVGYALKEADREAYDKMVEGWGEAGRGLTDEDLRDHPYLSSAVLTLEPAFRGLNAAIAGATGAVHGFSKTLYEGASGDTQGAERFARDISGMAEMQLQGVGVHGIPVGTPKIRKPQIEAIRSAQPWFETGQEPPAGLHPEIDKLKASRNDADLKLLDEGLKTSVATATRDRSPDMYAAFMRQHLGDGKIGISGERIAELYGDKVPAIDDNLLGWVPGIREQLEAARETGQDVQVPIADWLARVEPDLAKELHDDIRVRPGNITKTEAENKLETTPIESPLAQVRAASSLEPMYSIGDRKLTLNRINPNSPQDLATAAGLKWEELQPYQKEQFEAKARIKSQFGPEQGFHDFDLKDETGRTIGAVNISAQEGGKQLYIDSIAGVNGLGPRDFGPSLMRDLLRQLKEQFPEAETITGHRVSGARDKAGSFGQPSAHPVVRLEDISNADVKALHDHLNGAYWEHFSETLAGALKPTELYSAHEAELTKAVNAELDRIVPKKVDVQEVADIDLAGSDRKPAGAYIQYADRNPTIIWSLAAPDAIGVARHEAIHHLRQQGFFSEGEWKTLEKAATENGWLNDKIERGYGREPNDVKLEEAIAEGFRDWAKTKDNLTTRAKETVGLSSPIERIFRKLQDLLDAIGKKFKEILGHEPTWDELFEKAFSGEIGQREGGKPLNPEAFRLSVEDRADMLRANATGLDLQSFKRIQKLIEARYAEDYAAAMKRAEAEQRKRQSDEWKAQAQAMRPQVVEDINARPDIAADSFLRAGEFLGKKLDKAVKLKADDLTSEQAASLPREYMNKGGAPKDEVANLFGFRTGDEMIERLAALNAERIASGKNPDLFRRQLIDDELQRRMEREHGFLEKNILEEAQDQALSKTQLDLLVEEYHAAGMAAKVSTLDIDTIKVYAKDVFDKLSVDDVRSTRYMELMGKYGRDAERALIAGKPAEAIKAMEHKVYSHIMAKQAAELKKEFAKFDRLANRYKRPFDPIKSQSIDPHYDLFIRDILGKLQRPNGMFGDNLASRMERSGYDNLADFVAKKESEYAIAGLQIPVADFLMNPRFSQAADALTVDQFRAAKASVDSLDMLGREAQKVNIRGAKEDLKALGEKAAEQLSNKWEPIDYGIKKPRIVKDALKRGITASTANETLMRRFDNRDPKGLFTKTITYPAAEAANHFDRLHREYAEKYKDLGPIKDGDKKLESPFIDPQTGKPLSGVTRNTLAVVISNMGNEYNWRVLTKGWKVDPKVLKKWVEDNSTVEDIERAQKLGRIFDNAKGKSDTVYENLYGAAPQNIEVRPFTMHGQEFDGWYHPIIRDRIRSRHANDLEATDKPDGNNFWPSTSNSYTKRRTGAIDVVDLTYDFIPLQLNQILHEVAFKSFVFNTAKLFKTGRVLDNVTKHYGKEYADEMNMWLSRIAGNASYNEPAMSSAIKLSNDIRQNVISTYIAFGLTTVQKHGFTAAVMSARQVGAKAFVKAAGQVIPSLFGHTVMDMFGKSEALGDTLHKFVEENSEEIQRRKRNWEETIRGQQTKFDTGEGKGVVTQFLPSAVKARNKAIEWGSAWVAKSDLISAEPTWLAKYNEVMAESADHMQAVDEANAAVRLAHGSTAVTNAPRIAAGTGVLAPWMTTLYGFFGTNMQRRIEIMHDFNDAWKLGREGEIKAAAKMMPKVLGDIMTYVVWVGVVEEAVAHQFSDDKHGALYHSLAFTIGTLASTFIGLRDLAYGLTHGRDPGTGLISSPLHDIANVVRNVQKDRPLSKEHAGKFVEDGITLFGDLTGMGPKHVGTAIHYGMDYATGVQRPRTAGDVYRGLVSGKQEKHHK